MTIRQQWNALLERLGIDADADMRVSDEQLETLNEALTARSDPETGVPADEESVLRQTAVATTTLPHEDPSPTETSGSANEKAYANDIRNFRL